MRGVRMPVRPDQLRSVLAKGLAPVYLVSGDDTTCHRSLRPNYCGGPRRAIQSAAYITYTGFSWHSLGQDAASLSLFAERKFDVRVPSKKLDKDASALLEIGLRLTARQQIRFCYCAPTGCSLSSVPAHGLKR